MGNTDLNALGCEFCRPFPLAPRSGSAGTGPAGLLFGRTRSCCAQPGYGPGGCDGWIKPALEVFFSPSKAFGWPIFGMGRTADPCAEIKG